MGFSVRYPWVFFLLALSTIQLQKNYTSRVEKKRRFRRFLPRRPMKVPRRRRFAPLLGCSCSPIGVPPPIASLSEYSKQSSQRKYAHSRQPKFLSDLTLLWQRLHLRRRGRPSIEISRTRRPCCCGQVTLKIAPNSTFSLPNCISSFCFRMTPHLSRNCLTARF